MLILSKKLRFVISSLILSAGFISTQFIDGTSKFLVIIILVILSGALSAWSFYEGLNLNMTLLSLILPMLFTLGVGVFWFLLPSSIYTNIPIVLFYAIGSYVISSTMNIYTVASSKSIALLRAARGVGFVLSLFTAFFVFDAILSIRLNVFVTSLLIFATSFLVITQGLWSIDLETKFDKALLQMSLVSSVIITELSVAIFFWPVTVVVGSLFLTSGVYLLLGLGQAKLEDRLFPNVVREYLTVGAIVLIGMFFATQWGR
jgi:hypothetical protein